MTYIRCLLLELTLLDQKHITILVGKPSNFREVSLSSMRVIGAHSSFA